MPCKIGGRRPPLPAFVPRLRDCGVASSRRIEIHSRILNENQVRMSNVATMTKLIALVTAGLFAAGTMFAGEHGNCTKQVGNEAKMACTVSLASLNLTPDQKTKMDAALTEHQKAGCSDASEAKYMETAKGTLTPEQYAKFKAQCKKGENEKTQT